MVNFDDLKRMFEEEQRIKQIEEERSLEAQRIREEQNRRIEEVRQSEERRKINRAGVENERWGTPERAYRTWEERTRKLLVMEGDFIQVLREESRQAMESYGAVEFAINSHRSGRKIGTLLPRYLSFQPNSTTLSRRKIGGGWRYDPGFFYILMWDGKQFYVNSSYKMGFSQGTIGNPDGLVEIIHKIFKPLVAAHSIEHGTSGIVDFGRDYFDAGKILLKLPPDNFYEFNCVYPENSNTTEDLVTLIVFGQSSLSFDRKYIINPLYPQEVKRSLLDYAWLVTKHEPFVTDTTARVR